MYSFKRPKIVATNPPQQEEKEEKRSTEKDHQDRPPRNLNKDPIIIVLMGATGAGKSTFIKYATGNEGFIRHDQASGMSEVRSFKIPGSNVWLVDTPGFDNIFEADATILHNINKFFADMFNQGLKIDGVIYIHPITEVRMKGSAMKNLSMFRNLIGIDNMSSCCVVTTKWSLQESAISESREDELRTNPKFWQPLLARGAKIARFGDSVESAISIIKSLINDKEFVPEITIETQIQRKRLIDTEAGRVVNMDLEAALKAHKTELAYLDIQHDQAFADKDAELLRLLEEEKQTLDAELQQMEFRHKVLRETLEKRSHNRWIMR